MRYVIKKMEYVSAERVSEVRDAISAFLVSTIIQIVFLATAHCMAACLLIAIIPESVPAFRISPERPVHRAVLATTNTQNVFDVTVTFTDQMEFPAMPRDSASVFPISKARHAISAKRVSTTSLLARSAIVILLELFLNLLAVVQFRLENCVNARSV